MPRTQHAYALDGDAETRIIYEFENLYSTKQEVEHRVLTRAPLAKDLAAGELLLALVSGEFRLYTKYQGQLYYLVWTAA